MVNGKGAAMNEWEYKGGVHRQATQILHRLTRPHKTPERQMNSANGMYTNFAGHWCWLFKRKNMYYATIEGKGDTQLAPSLASLEILVEKGAIKK